MSGADLCLGHPDGKIRHTEGPASGNEARLVPLFRESRRAGRQERRAAGKAIRQIPERGCPRPRSPGSSEPTDPEGSSPRILRPAAGPAGPHTTAACSARAEEAEIRTRAAPPGARPQDVRGTSTGHENENGQRRRRDPEAGQLQQIEAGDHEHTREHRSGSSSAAGEDLRDLRTLRPIRQRDQRAPDGRPDAPRPPGMV